MINKLFLTWLCLSFLVFVACCVIGWSYLLPRDHLLGEKLYFTTIWVGFGATQFGFYAWADWLRS